MKKYLLTTTAAGAALAMTVPAHASGYVSIFGGYSMNDQKASARIFQSSDSFDVTETVFGSWNFTNSHTHTRSEFFTAVSSHTGVSGTHYWSTQQRTIYHSGSNWTSAIDADFKANDGFVIGAAWGCELAAGLRGEIEFAYRKHDVDAEGTWYFFSKYSTTTAHVTYRRGYFHAFGVTEGGGATVDGSPISNSENFGFFTYLSSVSEVTKTGGGSFTKTFFKESGDLTAMSIMANAWLDVDLGLGDNIRTYVGAGLGYADVKLDIGPVDVSDSGVAFQIGAGVAFDLPKEGHSLGLEVRRFVVPKLELEVNGFEIPLDYETTDILIKYTIQL